MPGRSLCHNCCRIDIEPRDDRGKLRDSFFSNRVVSDWNSLSDDMIMSSPKTFAAKLQTVTLPSSVTNGPSY